MTIDKTNKSHIIADDGKIFKRISDDTIYGKEIYLGFTFFMNGKKLDLPKMETPDDFCEIEE